MPESTQLGQLDFSSVDFTLPLQGVVFLQA
jgi:hypothetical protein